MLIRVFQWSDICPAYNRTVFRGSIWSSLQGPAKWRDDPQIFGGAATDIVDVSTRVDRRMFEWTGRLVALSSLQPRLGDYINQSGNGDHWRLQVPDLAPISTPHQRAAAGSATALLIAEN